MKHKALKKLIVFMAVLFFGGCVPNNYPVPHGTWETSDPWAILDIGRRPNPPNPITGRHWSGVYRLGDDIRPVIVSFHTVRGQMSVYYADKAGAHSQWEGTRIFWGTYQLEGDTLYFYIFPAYVERHGYETIIFHRIPDDEIDWEAMRDQLNFQ